MSWTPEASGTGRSLSSVTFGDGTFVAVGAEGTILTSTDGLNWTSRVSGTDTSLGRVVFGNDTFVAAGRFIVTSTDTVTWKVVPVGVVGVGGVSIAFGNGKFLASIVSNCFLGCIDGSTIASSDGVTWEEVSGGGLGTLTFGDGLFVGSSYGWIETSPDGSTWTIVWSGTGPTFNAMTYGKGLFVGVGEGGIIETSPDLTAWTTRITRTTDKDLRGIGFGNGTFVAVGGNNTVISSPDGTTWTTGTSPGYFSAVTFVNDTFMMVGPLGLATSSDGTTWTLRLSGISLSGVAFGNGTFVAVGNTILTSPDGTTWTVRTPPAQPFGASAVTFGKNTFLAAGSAFFFSPDGATWVQSSPKPASTALKGVAFGNGVFVAVGVGDNTIFSSPNGVTWTPRASSTEVPELNGITFADGTFVAVGDFGLIMTSADGATWVKRDSGTRNMLTSVAFGNGTFVVVGQYGSILQSDRVISPDIKANSSEGPITLREGETLSVTLSLDAGDGAGTYADWWVIADTPVGLYYFAPPGLWYSASAGFRPAFQGPLFNLAPVEVLNLAGLPAGPYLFYFGVDTNVNGYIDYGHLYFDYVSVDIER
ncbi:MAG: hypothetical protein P8Z71_08065 [Candidatus Sulfobium sp.]